MIMETGRTGGRNSHQGPTAHYCGKTGHYRPISLVLNVK
jgi:hypothetical protein